MKTMNLSKYNNQQIKELKNEMKIMSSLNHPNIVRLLESFQGRKAGKHTITLIMELCSGGVCVDKCV